MINVAILTVNGPAAEGLAFDTSGPAIRDCLPPDTFSVKQHQVVPEDKGLISAVVEKWCKPESDIQLVITTGGTGIGKTDVTPEALTGILQTLIPGIPEAIRQAGTQKTPRAMLSRGVAGIRNRTLVVSVQGNPDFARQAMQVILPALKHAVATITADAA
jgi:molybdenum cofactor synthesis domain-containing protein